MIIHTSVFGSYVVVVLMALVLLPWLSSVSEKHPSIYCEEKNTHIMYTQVTVQCSVLIVLCIVMPNPQKCAYHLKAVDCINQLHMS